MQITKVVCIFVIDKEGKDNKLNDKNTNGGDYAFFETSILCNGVKVATLHETSSEFDFCQLTCNFTQTNGVDTPIGAMAINKSDAEFYADENGVIGEEAFSKLLDVHNT